MDRLKLIALMVLLPLAMALLGVWELQRVRGEAAAYSRSAPEVQAEIAELQEMQRRVMLDMRTTIRVGDKTYAYGAARALLQDKIDRLSGNSWAYQRVGPKVISSFAALAIFGGVGGTLLGAGGLVWATVAGQLARRSREELMRVFSLSRRLLPFLLIGTVLFIVIALLGLTGAEGWRLVDRIASGARAKGEMRLWVMLVVVGGMSVWAGAVALFNLRSAFSAFVVGPLYQHGRAVTAAEAPGLWQHVESVAKAVRARPPQNIVVGLTDGFYATAHDVVLVPEHRTVTGETLYLPLTHTALLRPDEFSSIVGHELGHFAGEDTAYTRRFVPMYTGMRHSLASLANDAHWTARPAYLLGEYLVQQIDHAVLHWSREREFAADAVGMHVAGGRASARALVRIQAVSSATHEFLSTVLNRNEPPPADLVDALVAHTVQQGLKADPNDLDHAPPHPTDTHPPTLQRLKALGEVVDDRLIAEATAPVDRRGLDLLQSFFTDRQAITGQLSADLAGDSAEHRNAVRAELVRMVDEGEPASHLHERTAPAVAMFAVLAVLFAGGAVFLSVAPGLVSRDLGLMRTGAMTLGLLAFAMGVLIVNFHLRGRKPLLALTPTGVGGPAFAAEVPWQHIDEVQLSAGQGCLLEFKFELKAPVPSLTRAHTRRIRWKPKPRKLEVRFGAPRGMTPQQLLDRITRYRRADHARRALEAF